MRDEHPMDDYDGGTVSQRFDAQPEMAEAWQRLVDGTSTPTDRLLLQHELTESNYLRGHPGATYSEAHGAANDAANWWAEAGDG